MAKKPVFLNRIKRRWPRPLRSRAELAFLDFAFTLTLDRICKEAGGSHDVTIGGDLVATALNIKQVAGLAVDTLKQLKVPQSDWDTTKPGPDIKPICDVEPEDGDCRGK